MTTELLPGVEFEPGARRAQLLEVYAVDLVIDVGANAGQYARSLRESAYPGRIASFEPASAPFAALQRATAADARWECHRLALGRARGQAVLNIAADDRASSLLGVMDRHVDAAPQSGFVGREEVDLETLDSVWSDLRIEAASPYLKIDVQGCELDVLRGGETVVAQCVLVELELSLTPLYEGGPLFHEALDWLRARDFTPVAFECVLDDRRTGEMLQLDGIFAAQARLAERA
jgi:FkbM family methyltransferase